VSAFAAYISTIPDADDYSKTLDRSNTFNGYEPGNLAWVDPPEQIKNRVSQLCPRGRGRCYYNGETKTRQQWTDEAFVKAFGVTERDFIAKYYVLDVDE